jgi:outer membrane protein assembly factor BamE (lipoprotein component of BamABCDE complex)
MMMRNKVSICLATVALIGGCQTASEHARDVNTAQSAGDRVTVGKVQRQIKVGMTNAQVVEVLGSPNMVTTDEQRRENWVYDKIATTTVYSASSGGVSTLFLGGALTGSAAFGGAAGGGYRSGAGASSTTQRTLTIIIKFDKNNRVRDFAYRSSSF